MQPDGLRNHGVGARLSAWSVLLFVGAALGILLTAPRIHLEGGAIKAVVHLLTLGGILGAFYPLQNALWEKLYGRPLLWPRLTLLIWAIHAGGVMLLAWGFFIQSTLIAHLGGHYLIPTAIVLTFCQGVAAGVKRGPGRRRHLAAHLPGLGLLVTAALGAMMVLDAFGGGYGIYTPYTIMVHAAAGGFLFFLPFGRCMQMMDGAEAPAAPEAPPALASVSATASVQPGPFASTASLLLPVGAASLGVLALALGGAALGGTAPGGAEQGAGLLPARLWVAGGLGLLGAVALWEGLPAFGLGKKPLTLQGLRRSPWSAVGVLLLYAAIRAGRAAPEEEYLALMGFTVTLFLFAVALPEVLARLARHFAPPGDASAMQFEAIQSVLLLFVAGLVLVAQLAGMSMLVRLAALPGLVLLFWQARRLWASAGA